MVSKNINKLSCGFHFRKNVGVIGRIKHFSSLTIYMLRPYPEFVIGGRGWRGVPRTILQVMR